MQVVFESRDADGTQMRELSVDRVRFALRRLSALVARAKVQFSDVNGPRGGVDKRCQVEVQTDALDSGQVKRVLRNTYALLALTLLFSAGVAVAALTLQLPAPGLVLTLVGYFGLLFAVYKLKNSAWALPAVFGLTGFMGYTLGPLLTHALALPGGAQTVTLALGATGATFLSLSAYVLLTRRDFSFMGGFLFAGMVIALLAAIAAVFLQIPALGLAVSAMVALLSAGLILFETSRIVNGGESNYVLATVGLYVSVFNLFTSLLSLFGWGGAND